MKTKASFKAYVLYDGRYPWGYKIAREERRSGVLFFSREVAERSCGVRLFGLRVKEVEIPIGYNMKRKRK